MDLRLREATPLLLPARRESEAAKTLFFCRHPLSSVSDVCLEYLASGMRRRDTWPIFLDAVEHLRLFLSYGRTA